MSGTELAKLREAIFAGFNHASLDEVLRDNNLFRPNVATGPTFAAHVNSLIDVARQEGWLIELCGVLAAARPNNKRVSSAILSVQKWLIDQSGANENTLDGKMRATLREAILMGFNSQMLDMVLQDNDMLSHNVPRDAAFATRVNSLIDVAFQEGWLIELCGVLAAERVENKAVHSAIVSVRKQLTGQRGTDDFDLQGGESPGPVGGARAAPSVAHVALSEEDRGVLIDILAARLTSEDQRAAWIKSLLVRAKLYGQLAGEDYGGSAMTSATTVVTRAEALGRKPVQLLVDALRKHELVSAEHLPYLEALAERLSREHQSP